MIAVKAVRLPHRFVLRPTRRSRLRGARVVRAQAPSMFLRGVRSAQRSVGAEKMRRKDVLKFWREAEAVCFDVDSTLIQEESIDELADFMGMGEEVALLTQRAMSGDMRFEQALDLRLRAMQPSKSDVRRFVKERPPRVTPGIPELVSKLQAGGTAVYLISGGFREIIEPIADSLAIEQTNVFANSILFDGEGNYRGFDKTEFTSRSGGKAQAVQSIKEMHGYHPMVMVGDGATDLEARTAGAVDLFIGYGGVVERPLIAERADWYVKDVTDLLEALSEAH